MLFTSGEAAAAAGVDPAWAAALRSAAGLAEPASDEVWATPADVEFLKSMSLGAEFFSEHEIENLLRAIGIAMAQVANATISTFLVNVDMPNRAPGVTSTPPEMFSLTRELLPHLSSTLDLLLRHHIAGSPRAQEVDFSSGYEVISMAIGFVDLVGSTELTERLSTTELGQMLTGFEELATTVTAQGGGRVVKLIGDEVMFVSEDPATTAHIGLEMLSRIAEHPSVPAARGAVAFGQVVSRQGDYFGRPVNTAARLVTHAATGSLLVTEEVQQAMSEAAEVTDPIASEPAGFFQLAGLAGTCQAWTLAG